MSDNYVVRKFHWKEKVMYEVRGMYKEGGDWCSVTLATCETLSEAKLAQREAIKKYGDENPIRIFKDGSRYC